MLQYTIFTPYPLHKLVSFTQPPCPFTFTGPFIRITASALLLLIHSYNYFPCRILAFYLCIAYTLHHNTSSPAHASRIPARSPASALRIALYIRPAHSHDTQPATDTIQLSITIRLQHQHDDVTIIYT